MKKIISVLLVFAAIASLMSVCGFAAEATSVNGILNEMVSAYTDFVAPIVEDFNCGANDIVFDMGVNDFLASIDAFFESICVAIVDLVATVENLF
ncbi:MAG: hypothetical protein IJE74_04235 [Clostridia bacterium]|nr:hypothetical protein [Clostridia bacterium]